MPSPGVARHIRRCPADSGCGSTGRAGAYERELERAANARSTRSGGDLACRGYCQRSRLIGVRVLECCQARIICAASVTLRRANPVSPSEGLSRRHGRADAAQQY